MTEQLIGSRLGSADQIYGGCVGWCRKHAIEILTFAGKYCMRHCWLNYQFEMMAKRFV
jgi:hypothetical protein